MGTTPKGYPYPDGGDPPDGPTNIHALALVNDVLPGVSTLTYAGINSIAGGGLWEGRLISQTDTGTNRPYQGLYEYNGVNWRLPWNMPWGLVIRGIKTASQTDADSSEHAITGGWQPIFDAVDNRQYRITVNGLWRVAAASNVTVRVKDSTTLIETGRQVGFASAADDKTITFAVETDFTAGSHTIQVTQQCSNAAGTTCLGANASLIVTVDDVGPMGAAT